MVTRARAHSMAKLIRASAHEAATLDEELAMSPTGPWAVLCTQLHRGALRCFGGLAGIAACARHVTHRQARGGEGTSAAAAAAVSGVWIGARPRHGRSHGSRGRHDCPRVEGMRPQSEQYRVGHEPSAHDLATRAQPPRALVASNGLPLAPQPPPPRASGPAHVPQTTAPCVPVVTAGTLFTPFMLPTHTVASAVHQPIAKPPPPALGADKAW